jgi:transposase-like protein
MSKRIRRRFTEEFRSRAAAMVIEEGQPVSRVCADLDLVDSVLRRWIDEARGVTAPGKQVPAQPLAITPEQAELQQLRRENQILRMEREILKKATAFFAKEST